MDFADPLHGDRSLRQNPFLQEYYADLDRQNQASASPKSCVKSVHGRSFKVQNNPARSAHSKPLIAFASRDHNMARSRGGKCDVVRSYERDRNENSNRMIQNEVPATSDLGLKVFEIVVDRDPLDIAGYARVLALANVFQRDEEQRAERRIDHRQVQVEINKEISKEAWDHFTDPFGDSDPLDLNQPRRVDALVKAIPSENHLIQIASGDGQKVSKKSYIAERDIFQHESDVRNQIQDHQKKMGFIKKAGLKLEQFIEKNAPKANPLHFDGEISQKIIQVANASQDQKIQNFENIIRGINDYAVWSSDALLDIAPWVKHSSEEFYEKHRMKRKGDGFENSLYYGTGIALGVFMEIALTRGAAGVAAKGFAISKKVGDTLLRAGIKAGTIAQLTTGGIGRGASAGLPHALGGPNVVLQEGTFALRVLTDVKLKKATEVAKVIKNSPELLKKSPQLAEFILKPITDGPAFFSDLAKLTNRLATVRKFTNLTVATSILPETDPIVNEAIGQIVQNTSDAEAVFEDFGKICDSLDDSVKCFDAYLEFAHRQQMRQFVKEMDCPKEAIPYVMKKIPKRADSNDTTLEKAVKNIINAQDTINYCDKYVKDPWVREKLLQLLMPLQKHHVFTNKCVKKEWTRDFKKIFDQYQIDIEKHWNLLLLPHLPQAHSDKYHKRCLDALDQADEIVQSQKGLTIQEQRELLLRIIEEKVILPLLRNPLLPMHKWYKFWQSDKLQADSMKSSSTREETTTTPL